jgi:hypothetical protein
MGPVLLFLGLYHLGLGLLMAVDPGTFFDKIGDFGVRNDHYIRDTSTFYLALGGMLLVAASRVTWRVPALFFAAAQYVLHVLNHFKDVGDSDHGWFDAISLSVMGVVLVWLLLAALRTERTT